MSNINELVDYLNPKKHKWINKARGAYHLYRIDAKFLEEHQDINSTKVTKLVKLSLPGKRVFNDDFLRITAPDQKLFVVLEQGSVSYYFQRIQQDVVTYISLENLILPGFDESHYQPYNELTFVEIDLQFIHFYHRVQGQIYSVAILHENVSMTHRKTLKYNPNELGGLTNGKKFLDYKNAFGNTDSFWDRTTGSIFDIDVGAQELRTIHLFLNDQLGELYWYPKITVGQQGIILEYNYHPRKNDHLEDGVIKQPAILLRFPYREGFLAFMMLTYFNNGVVAFDVWDGSMMRKPECFKAYTEIVLKLLKDVNSNIIQLLRYLYFIPAEFFIKKQTLYKKLNNGTNVLGEEFLWLVLNRALHELLIINNRVNKEDIVFKLLEMLNIVQENEYFQFKEKNDYLLHQLLTRTVKEEVEQEQANNDDKKVFKYSSYLIFLYNSMHTANFTKYNYFIYKLWKNSSYINPLHPIYETSYITKRTDKEEKDKKKPPLMLPYTTNEIVGFYTSSINSEFNENEHIVLTPDNANWDNVLKAFYITDPSVGEAAENLAEDDWKVTYHPLHPVRLPDPTNKKAIALQPISPALLLKANEDRSFWNNVGTAAEYAADAITTLTGIANLSKFRHLARTTSILNRTKQAYISARIIHAQAEISISTINALLKITGLNKTEFGKALGDFLFWMEMLTLSVDITDAISAGLRNSSKKLITKYADDLNTQLDDLIKKGEIKVDKGKVIDELEATSGKKRAKISKDFRIEYGKKSLRDIDFNLVLKNMKGITDEADKIIKHIEDKIINVHILDDAKFDNILREDGYPEDLIKDVTAMADLDIYLRASTDVDSAMGEIVHEGIHAIDYHKIDTMVDEGKALEEIIISFGDSHDFEVRAYLAEQKFQKEAGLEIDHKDYFEIKEHIEDNYPKKIYIEEVIEEISNLKNKE